MNFFYVGETVDVKSRNRDKRNDKEHLEEASFSFI